MKINERTLNKAIFNTDIHPLKKIQTHKTTFKQTDKHIKAKKKKRKTSPHTQQKDQSHFASPRRRWPKVAAAKCNKLSDLQPPNPGKLPRHDLLSPS